MRKKFISTAQNVISLEIKALQKLILESGFNENELKEIDNKIKLKVNEAADYAIESKLPDEAELFKDIIIE